MINPAIIYSTLGNPNSLIPLGVKDASSCLGMTAGSYVTGKEEGFDRFIDEFGTEAIWLGGIPTYKWLFDKTIFKSVGLDAKIDPRILKDKDVLNKIKEYAPSEKVRDNIKKAESKASLFKGLAVTKFVVSTVAAAVTYFALTRLKQYYTAQKIRKNLIEEYNQSQQQKNINQKVDENTNVNTKPSFKGTGKVIEEFAFSPVKNMYLMDGFITAERLADSRTKQEFIGYSIKEGSCLFFLYFAGKKIQKFMENRAKNKHNKSITLDSRVIEGAPLKLKNAADKYIVEPHLLKQSFMDGSIETCLEQFDKANTSNVNLYEFIHKNPDNKIIKILKLSDSIKLMKNSEKIDTRAYIDLDEVKAVKEQVKELYGQYKSAISKGESCEQFFKGLKKLKRMSILNNIGACILALGVITPGMMLIKRLTDDQGSEFQTKKDIKEQLIKEGIIS